MTLAKLASTPPKLILVMVFYPTVETLMKQWVNPAEHTRVSITQTHLSLLPTVDWMWTTV